MAILSFEATMMENFVLFNASCVLAYCILFKILCNRLKSGFLISVSGLIAAIAIVLACSAFGVIVVGIFTMPSFLNASAKNPFGLVAWGLETGIEFGLLAQITGIIAFIAFRVRGAKRVKEFKEVKENP